MKPLEDEETTEYIKRLKLAARMAKLEDTDNTIVMHVLCNSTSTQLKSKIMEITRKHKSNALDKLIEWLESQKVNSEILKDETARCYAIKTLQDEHTKPKTSFTVSAI
jgi:hypothetical protein